MGKTDIETKVSQKNTDFKNAQTDHYKKGKDIAKLEWELKQIAKKNDWQKRQGRNLHSRSMRVMRALRSRRTSAKVKKTLPARLKDIQNQMKNVNESIKTENQNYAAKKAELEAAKKARYAADKLVKKTKHAQLQLQRELAAKKAEIGEVNKEIQKHTARCSKLQKSKQTV